MGDNSLLKEMAAAIRSRRRDAGLTINQLAELAGIDSGFLSYIETGKKAPSIPTAAKIAGALDMRLSDLFEGTSLRRPQSNYKLERQVIAVLHGCSAEQKKAMLALLKKMRNPRRLEALQLLIAA